MQYNELRCSSTFIEHIENLMARRPSLGPPGWCVVEEANKARIYRLAGFSLIERSQVR